MEASPVVLVGDFLPPYYSTQIMMVARLGGTNLRRHQGYFGSCNHATGP